MPVELTSLGPLQWLDTLSRAHIALVAESGTALKYFGPLAQREVLHLEGQITRRLALSFRQRKLLDEHCCWPTDLVGHQGDPVGYLMRRARPMVALDQVAGPAALEQGRSLVEVVQKLEAMGEHVGGDPRYDWGFADSIEFLSCDEWPNGGASSPFAWDPDPRLAGIVHPGQNAALNVALRLVLGSQPPVATTGLAGGCDVAAVRDLLNTPSDGSRPAPDATTWLAALGGGPLTASQLTRLATTGEYEAVASAVTREAPTRADMALRALALRHVLAEHPISVAEVTAEPNRLLVTWNWPVSDLVVGARIQVYDTSQDSAIVVAEVAAPRSDGPGTASIDLAGGYRPTDLDVRVAPVAASPGPGPESWMSAPATPARIPAGGPAR